MTGWLLRDGVGLHWRLDGPSDGPPLLLLNSLGTDLRLWDGIVERLPGYRIVRLDTRGHGLSDAVPGPYRLETLVADAGALIDRLGVTRLAVAGVSLGGMMAQALAAARPEQISHLVLCNTGLVMGTAQMWNDRIKAVEGDGVASIAEAILDRWFAAGFRHGPEVGLWRNMLARTPAQGYAGCCAALAAADLTAVAPTLACPSLVVGGSDDLASPPATVRAVAEAIPGAAYVEIADVGHLPMVEAPDRMARLIADHLEDPAHG